MQREGFSVIAQVKNRPKVERHLNTQVFSPIQRSLIRRLFSGIFGAFALAFLPASSTAQATECEIISDVGLYYERLEQAHVLMEYKDIVVRATDGKIRCEEDAGNARQVCSVDGPGEMLVDSERGTFVVRLPADTASEVQIYQTGDLSCGPKSN